MVVKLVFSRYYMWMESNRIYDLVERISELLRVDVRQAVADVGLQPVQVEVLHYLSMSNRFSDTPMAVTEYLGQTKGTVSQTLKVLEKKGLISKRSDNEDKRSYHLSVTAKGKRLLSKTIPTEIFVRACDSLSEKKQKEISHSLQLLLGTLLKTNEMKSFGVCASCRFNSRDKAGGYFCNLIQEPLTAKETELICREHEYTT